MVERNKKRKKGTPEEPVPFLLKIQEIEGEWYYVKNPKLRGLTLGWNKLKQNSVQTIKSFVNRVNSGREAPFEIVLTGNEFNSTTVDILKELQGIKI